MRRWCRLKLATTSLKALGVIPYMVRRRPLCATFFHLIRNTSCQPAKPHCFSPVSFSEALCPIQNNLLSNGAVYIA